MDRSYEAEFAEVVAAKGAALRRTAYLMCGDWHLAEDLVQAVFVKVHLHWRRIRRQDSFDAYLRTTLFRVYIDTRRSKWRRETPAEYLPDVEARGTGPSDDRDILVAALRRIPPRQRAVLVLRYWEDLSIEETAGLLGCAAGTVKSQAAKGLAALRPLLAGTVFEPVAREH
ncbi:RNA polymerase sigma-70 factor (sigma-E family) [Catenulispora sp. EB89]|uniref:SigE family RNA polymerase sigma factor n=1 Tax=Catenulispora sp. EB89 TaxID=3156257 RepID=UPI0035170FC8